EPRERKTQRHVELRALLPGRRAHRRGDCRQIAALRRGPRRGREERAAGLADDLLALGLERRGRAKDDARPWLRILRQYHVRQDRGHERTGCGLTEPGR